MAAWSYREEATADLDGDGSNEKIVLAADVQLGSNATPLWEDGHRWGLFAETARGDRTMLYAAFVPNGRPAAAILEPDRQGRRMVLIEERGASQLRVFEVEYERPKKARLSSASYCQVERWLTPRK